MIIRNNKAIIFIIVVVIVLSLLLYNFLNKKVPVYIAHSNGRIEAQEIDVSTKYSGRITEITVQEGDTVNVGQIIARLDITEYQAQLHGAEAQLLKAKEALIGTDALIAQSDSNRTFTQSELHRSEALLQKRLIAKSIVEQRHNQLNKAIADYDEAKSKRAQALSSIKEAEANVARFNAILNDMVLIAPCRGRVQYKLVQIGEVVASGARIVTILDLSDVYMTLYLPAAEVAGISLGDEARIILDPFPQYILPGQVTFVSSEAQFTPKSVETHDEREKLMFQVKISIDNELLKRFEQQVKTGIRGIGFVRTRREAVWPANLVIKIPQS